MEQLNREWDAFGDEAPQEPRRQIRGLSNEAGMILRHGGRWAWEEAEALSTRYHDLFEHAPIGYLSLDRSGNVLQMNRTARNLLENCPAFLEGDFALCLAGHDRETFRGFLDRAFATKAKLVRAVELLQGDGRLVFVRLEVAVPRKSDQECFMVMVEESLTHDLGA